VSDFEAGLDTIRQAPADTGSVELIVRRPAVEEREVVDEAELDLSAGLVGDNWSTRGSRAMADGSANPKAQLTVMSARLAALVAGPREEWPLAGDQFYVDFDLSKENVPGRHATLGRVGGHRGHRRAAHGMREVQRALRLGCAPLHQLASRTRAQPPRHQCAGGRAGTCAARRRDPQAVAAMQRIISGFHRDAEGDWVAELDCGHQQHVRHRPPFQNRPWVLSDTERAAHVGSARDCPLCDAERGGEAACLAHLVCPDCGSVGGEGRGHRDGCPRATT
jgi:hypothetical protein